MPAVVQALADRGAIVEIIHPVDPMMNLSELRVEHDLYVLRHTSGVSLSLAGALHELGAVIVNPYPVSAALRDKIVTMRTLQAAGVSTPASYLAPHPNHLRPLLDSGPLVIKPYQGADGAGVSVVRNDGELAAVNHGCEPLFAQRYHPGDGRDRKIYAIGGRLFGVKKVFPRWTEEEKHGEPFALTPQLQDIAERCGRAFGIDLYGVDIIESEGTPYVVDMCSIPGFKGVPDAVGLLTQYFYAAAERAARGELLSHRPHWRSRGVTSMPRPQLLTDALHEHPALQAWRRVSAGSAQACSIEVLKRKRQFAVYRVNGVGPGRASIIAKRCRQATSDVERVIYDDLLPRLPLPSLRCYGSVREDDGQLCWLFLEDAGSSPYRAVDPYDRVLAGWWLGEMHVAPVPGEVRNQLPGRDVGYYRQVIHRCRLRLLEHLANTPLSAEHTRLFRRLVAFCDVLELHWTEIEIACSLMPPTLVHGDFASKNLRIRPSAAGERALLVFDWQFAGWGVPATDLAQFIGRVASPDLGAYASVLNQRGLHIDVQDVQRLAACGAVFRVLNEIDWATVDLPSGDPASLGKAVAALQVYDSTTRSALKAVNEGWA